MMSLMLQNARELTEDEAGGHGDHWEVFQEDVEAFVNQRMREAVEKGLPPVSGLTPDLSPLAEAGEPNAVALFYGAECPLSRNTGWLSVIESDPARNELRLCSMYPVFGEGVVLDATVAKIDLFPNRLESRLELNLVAGGVIDVFDTHFWKHRALYEEDAVYRFNVSALAYAMKPVGEQVMVMDDPEQVRRYHARKAWAEQHGAWTKDDEAAALAAWQPESPDDLEPIRFHMEQMAMLMPAGNGFRDDAVYQGEVMRVTPATFTLFGVSFWRVEVTVWRDDQDMVLPFFVAERLFPGDWRPAVGDYVQGTAWLQAYAVAGTLAS
jgi:hypothetical protein